MTDSMKKKAIIFLLIIAFSLILTPIFIYGFHFGITPLSNNKTDWGAYGDFIGGTVNTIISLISLIVLGYITYLVSKNTNEESRKQQLLLRKMDVYDKLGNYILESLMAFRKWETNANYILELQKTFESNSEHWADYIRKTRSDFNILMEMIYYIQSFKTMAGHLFKYNFEREEFKNLQEAATSLSNYIKKVDDFHNSEEKTIEDGNETIMNFSNHMDLFLKTLQKEIL